MITEEMLCSAAAKSCEIYADQLADGYDANLQHEFSPEFENKIRKLKRRANHPFLYRAVQQVACIILVMMIAGGTWISVSAEARAAFFGWVKGVYETYFTYHFEGESINDPKTEYRPAWVPEGYTETFCDDEENTVFVVYSNDLGQVVSFNYVSNPNDTTWFIDQNNTITEQVSINGNEGTLFLATDSDENTNVIVWSTTDNTAFLISGFLDEAELIRMAESVQPVKK